MLCRAAAGGFFEDVERVQEEIWFLVDPGGMVVVDVGAGDSTQIPRAGHHSGGLG